MQPFPYQGSKRVIADAVVGLLPATCSTLIEPFAGSAAVSLVARSMASTEHIVLNDLNKPLIELWRAILCDPEALAKKYEQLFNSGVADPAGNYLAVRDQFNATHRPELLLYLLYRCVKSAVRYNTAGEFNQSADKRRLGAKPSVVARNLAGAAALLDGATVLRSVDYSSVLQIATPEDVVYLDPPYQGTSGQRNQRYVSGIDFGAFVLALRALHVRNIPYLLSYDGRTGTKTYGQALPEDLGLVRVDVDAGPSTQATLLGRSERTIEALFISPALQHLLGPKGHALVAS